MDNRRRRPHPNYDPPAGCPPRWVWLLAGMLIGIFISFLFYLREVAPRVEEFTAVTKSATQSQTATGTDTKATPEKTVSPTPAAPTTRPAFEFYDTLPKTEVKLPTEVLGKPATDDLLVTKSGKYILQVGSFREKSQADGLKAHLMTLGITAQVEPMTTSAESWYRVQVGPFTNLDDLNQTRAVLSENEIPTILLKF